MFRSLRNCIVSLFGPPLYEGFSQTQENGKWFHVRPDGTPAYEARFDAVGPFSGGLAWVRLDGVEFHIRPDGTPAYKARFSRVWRFIGGRAWVEDFSMERYQINQFGGRVKIK